MASNDRKVLLVSPDNKVERSTIEKKIDWYKCYICQKSTNEKLQCPANIVRSNFDPLKAYYEVAQNMIKLKEILNSVRYRLKLIRRRRRHQPNITRSERTAPFLVQIRVQRCTSTTSVRTKNLKKEV